MPARLGADGTGQCSSQPALETKRDGYESGGVLHTEHDLDKVVRWGGSFWVDSTLEPGCGLSGQQ